MPRILNWIRGEGTVKNQRWGLGEMTPHVGFGCVCNDGMGSVLFPTTPDPVVVSTSVANCPGDPSCPGYVAPGSTDYIQSLQDELANLYDIGTNQTMAPTVNVPVPATTIGQWVNANPLIVAIGGGLLVAMLFSRGR